ncbi:TIR domain-containing protein [Streptomyces sp. NBC_01363]|uniref:TIR domain-containing protein n=1 Tax=Streptomyces sp. NBC_01363 TaxID=2903840 RepID=UPI0022537E51|nr:TIR domain-containing protein [Streptomyces sp. NBC_01363]MCX4729449.1 TIR domain-containing protein [Streptomyces sp. NBC_01363]MCX4736905.1 TIR domain-containing protein [Streptomyces sp. NBC_01363]
MPKRAFVSFDYDYDKPLKDLLIGQAKNPDSPFEVYDWSIKEASQDWKVKARSRIRASDIVIVICGKHTHQAVGVAIELKLAQEEGIEYFLLNGYNGQTGKKPTTATDGDKIYKWTWPNLKTLVGGGR